MREITLKELKDLQSNNEKIIVDFKAKWCGPCKVLIPRLEKIEKDYPSVNFVMIDIDSDMESILDMGIRSVPTVLVMDGETLIERINGLQSEEIYKQVLEKIA
jgi:thioredoxin